MTLARTAPPVLGGLGASDLPAPPPDIDAAALAMERSPRMAETAETDAVAGRVVWAPAKSLWHAGMAAGALIGGPLFFTWDAFALFLATTATTVCLGHSLGMHRRLIHHAYSCPLWLERLFVYLGTRHPASFRGLARVPVR